MNVWRVTMVTGRTVDVKADVWNVEEGVFHFRTVRRLSEEGVETVTRVAFVVNKVEKVDLLSGSGEVPPRAKRHVDMLRERQRANSPFGLPFPFMNNRDGNGEDDDVVEEGMHARGYM